MAHGRDEHRPLEHCRVVLVGRFASLTHEELRVLVQDLGGRVDAGPMRHTKYLVIGEGCLPLDERARPPRAIEKARGLQVLGYPIEILSEQEFWNRCGLVGCEEPVRRLYTIGQLSRILGIKRGADRVGRTGNAPLGGGVFNAESASPLECVEGLPMGGHGERATSSKTMRDFA